MKPVEGYKTIQDSTWMLGSCRLGRVGDVMNGIASGFKIVRRFASGIRRVSFASLVGLRT